MDISTETAYAVACQLLGESIVRERVLGQTIEAQKRKIQQLTPPPEGLPEGSTEVELVEGVTDADLDQQQGEGQPDGGLASPPPQG